MIPTFRGRLFFLSNFYPSTVEFEGRLYPTVEHAYQAAKSLDSSDRNLVALAQTPAKAKYLGYKIKKREDWEQVKLKVMALLLKEKFKIPSLRALLLETGQEVLVEGNVWHDNHWGNCVCPKCSTIQGRNLLGKLLMSLRDLLNKGVSCDCDSANPA